MVFKDERNEHWPNNIEDHKETEENESREEWSDSNDLCEANNEAEHNHIIQNPELSEVPEGTHNEREEGTEDVHESKVCLVS